MEKRKSSREEIQRLYYTYTRYPWLYPLLVTLLSLCDILLIGLYYYTVYIMQEGAAWMVLAGLHLAFSVAVFFLRRYSSPQTKNISPVLFLILPGIGALIYGASYLSLYLIGASKVEYDLRHAYQDEEVTYEKKVSVDFAQVAGLMNMAGVFTYSDALKKKELIVDLLSAQTVQNCQMLKKGLHDPDPEVVHYTASTINYLENRFEKAIHEAREKSAEEFTKENLELVVRLYEQYIESGLLDEQIIPMYIKKMIEVLELQFERFENDLSVAKHLARAYMRIGRKSDAVFLLQQMAKQYPDDVEIQFVLMNYFYSIGDLVQVKNIADLLALGAVPLTKKQQSLIGFWTHEEQGEADAIEQEA